MVDGEICLVDVRSRPQQSWPAPGELAPAGGSAQSGCPLGAAALCTVALGLAVYLSSVALSTGSSVYLGSGRRFSPEDLSKISRGLDHQRLTYRIDDQRRVAVAAEQLELAGTAISKLELGPRPPGEIRDDQSAASSVWESIHDKELREFQGREKILESLIGDLPGIVGSFVWINRTKPRWGLQQAVKPSAFVRLETEGDRQLPFRTVQTLSTILTRTEPGLTADAVTVVDRRGHTYLDAGNPALSALSHNRAREEELSQQILEQLDWIGGVRVSVQLAETTRPGTSTVETRPAERRPSPDGKPVQSALEPPRGEPPSRWKPASGSGPETRTLAPAVAVNRPLTLDPEFPAPVPAPPCGAGVTSATSQPAAVPAADTGPPTIPRPGARELTGDTGVVWVRVPRSYYYKAGIALNRREPSLDEFQKLVARTEEQIRTGIGLVVNLSGPLSWTAKIDMISDDVPLDAPAAVASPRASRRVSMEWAVAGALGAVAVVMAAIGSWVLSTRRPALAPAAAPRNLRFHDASAFSPGPSERLREFVRRNPESAVSVLERWTSQGGTAS